ncbi:MAG TPA: VWA domain-containing protein [Methanothrix sp.]|nr:VWA domain-containing protein [Methanothrix sp.]
MSFYWAEVWNRSCSNWHWPLLPFPRLKASDKESIKSGEFPFANYSITLDEQMLSCGPLYLENLFDHLIVHYIFCPRSLEQAALLAQEALKGLERPDADRARRIVNIFTDIVVDSFRLERSAEDEGKVLLGWRRLSELSVQDDMAGKARPAWQDGRGRKKKQERQERQEGQDRRAEQAWHDGQEWQDRQAEQAVHAAKLMPLDRLILGFLREYWGADLPECHRPEVGLLSRLFSPGVRDKSLWPRQCRQMARILEPFLPGVLGRGSVRCLEVLNGSADALPLADAAGQEFMQYEKVLQTLGLKGDLARWYRDQSYSIVIRETPRSRSESYPSAPVKWRLTDPSSELDVAYSLSLSPRLIPGLTTYKRSQETGRLAPAGEAVPDLLVVLDSSRSMDGPRIGTKTHRATLAAFKACSFAHSKGAQIAAINFSEKYLVAPWTRDLGSVENVLVEFFSTRTHIPGKAIRKLAEQRPGCLILCITDTHIQNLYQEWEDIKKSAEAGRFVLFCIDQAYKDRHVEEALSSLGQVYYINRLEDLVAMVVDVTATAYCGESFISLQ